MGFKLVASGVDAQLREVRSCNCFVVVRSFLLIVKYEETPIIVAGWSAESQGDIWWLPLRADQLGGNPVYDSTFMHIHARFHRFSEPAQIHQQ